MIINTANIAALFLSYKSLFQDAFKDAESSWEKIATLVPSSTESNLYAFLGQFPRLRKWLGARIIKDMAVHNYTVVNEPFESTVGVPKPKIEDDTFGVFSPLMSEMGYAAKTHPDEIVFELLKLGASELCYDGQFFFDTDHPVLTLGVASTVANYDATGAGDLWIAMDTKRPLKPMIFQKRQEYNFVRFNSTNDEHVFMQNEYLFGVDTRVNAGFGLWQLAYGSLNTLDATNWDAIVTAMMQLKSDEDRPLSIRPNLIVVGPGNRAAARALFETSTLANGAANPNFKEVEVLVTPYLD